MPFPLLLFLICFSFCTGSSMSNVLSNLPAGKYKLNMKSIVPCKSFQNGKIHYNLFIRQTSNDTKEIWGNVTNEIPLDDTLVLNMNIAFRDPIKGWQENVFESKSLNGCSSLIRFMGNAWISWVSGFGIPNTCPIPTGTFKTDGINTSTFENSTLPKLFVYGSYKFRFFYTLKKEIVSCVIFIGDFNRP